MHEVADKKYPDAHTENVFELEHVAQLKEQQVPLIKVLDEIHVVHTVAEVQTSQSAEHCACTPC